jgi:alkylated DNA nucleotide flippase Atl1
MAAEQLQLNLTGERRKARGIKRVASKTPTYYQQAFERAVRALASSGRMFTSEAVTALVGQPPNHPNAVGAMMNGLASQGVIRKTGNYTKAQRDKRHAGLLAEWEGVR